jgi:peptidoglycan/xylan/chitin deacetylase (PgdA/CDA1 family)
MMLRSFAKNAAAYAVSLTRLDKIAHANRYRRLPFVVLYHRVVERMNAFDGVALPAMEISIEMLERHLEWIGQHFRIVSLDDLGAKLEDPAAAAPLAAVTFDDGYSDIYHYALPLLKRKGIPAGIFAVTDLVGSGELPLHERLYALLARAWRRWESPRTDLANRLRSANVDLSLPLERAVKDPFSATRFLLEGLPQDQLRCVVDVLTAEEDRCEELPPALQPLSWEMLAEMRDAGMHIGSHSKTHAFLPNESEQRVAEEVTSSRRELERRLGVEVESFAYPGGGFSPTVVEAVAAAGYRYAFTVCSHRDPQNSFLTIPRTGLWESSCLDPFGQFSPAIMSCQAAGAFSWAASCSDAHDGARQRGTVSARSM